MKEIVVLKLPDIQTFEIEPVKGKPSDVSITMISKGGETNSKIISRKLTIIDKENGQNVITMNYVKDLDLERFYNLGLGKTYEFCIMVTDDNGCINTQCKQFIIQSEGCEGLIGFDIGKTKKTYCKNDSVKLWISIKSAFDKFIKVDSISLYEMNKIILKYNHENICEMLIK